MHRSNFRGPGPWRHLVSLLLLLLAACGGGSGGAAPPSQSAPEVSVLSPSPGAVRNEDRVQVVVAFAGAAADLQTLAVRVNGQTIDLTGWTITGQGASGSTPSLPDGNHLVDVRVQSTAGVEGRAAVMLETSTGGGSTRLRGVLLDPDGNRPIPGAAIWLEEAPGIAVTTASDGSYELSDTQVLLPSGPNLHLMFDPRGLEFSEGGVSYVYPLYKRKLDVVGGALNLIEPCYLPRVRPHVTFSELANLGIFDCASQRFLQPYELSVDVGEGTGEALVVALTIPAGVHVDFLDQVQACAGGQYLAIAPVDKERAPSALPPGADPSLLITVQPTGMRFRTTAGGAPAALPISFPNRDEMPAESELVLFSVDHDTGEFVQMGMMRVDPADPTRIVTISGGLEGGSWHCSCPPEPSVQDAPEGFQECGFEQSALNPIVDTRTGFYREAHVLPTRQLLGESWGDALDYDSKALSSRSMLSADVVIPVQSAVPDHISVALTMAGIPTGQRLWFRSEGLSENDDSQLSLPFPVDVALPTTGLYPYQLAVTNHFPTSSVTAFVSGLVPRVVQERTPFGRGWNLASEARLREAVDRSLLLVEGAASISRFAPTLLNAPGLELTLYPFNESAGAYWGGQVARFFEGSTPMAFDEILPGEQPRTVSRTVIPSIDFPNQGSGVHMRYAGPNGQFEGTAQAPLGDDVTFTTDGASTNGHFGALFEGFFYAPFADTVVFGAGWDNGIAIDLGGTTILAVQGATGFSQSQPIQVDAGLTPIRVAFFDYGGSRRLQLYATGAGYQSSEPLPPSAFSRDGELELSDTYTGTRGDTSRIVRQPSGEFIRELTDGSEQRFDAQGRILARVDRRGRTTQYERDPSTGDIVALLDTVGGRTEFSYVGGRVATIRDPANRVTRLEYSGGDLAAIIDPTGARKRFTYEARGFMTSTIDEDGRQNTFTLDAAGRLLGVAYADGTSASVLPFNSSVASPLSGNTGLTPETAVYPRLAGEAQAITALPGRSETWQYESPVPAGIFPGVPLDSRVLVRTEQLPNARLRWILVARDRVTHAPLLTQVRVGPLSGTWPNAPVLYESTTEWDAARGLPLREVVKGLGQAADRATEYEWHPERSWLQRVRAGAGSANALELVLERDAMGNVIRSTSPTDSGANATTIFEYDSLSRVERTIDPTGVTVELTYDHPTGSVTGIRVGSSLTQVSLSDSGQPLTRTLGNGSVTRFERDALNRIVRVTEADDAVTRYGFTPTGRLAWVRRPNAAVGQEHLLNYDARGWLSSWRQPLGALVRRFYRPDGQLQRQIDPRGVEEVRSHDSLGRLTRVELRANANGPVSQSYAYTWTDLDQLESITTEASTVRYSYSPFGERVREEQELVGEESALVTWSFDELGRPVSMASSVGGAALVGQQRAYGASGNLSRVDGSLPGWTATFALTRDAAGRRTRMHRTGEVVTSYSYDAATGLLEQVRASALGSLVGQDDVSYDNAFDLTGWAQQRSLLPNAALIAGYDPTGRLTDTASASGAPWDASYGPYDRQGNRRTLTHTYDVVDRLLSDDTYAYSYDLAGNLVTRTPLSGSGPVRTFEWDQAGQLRRVLEDGALVAEFSYDGLGRRIHTRGRLQGGGPLLAERFVYDGPDVIGIRRAQGPHAAILHGPGVDEPWAIAQGGQVEYLLADILGSVTQRYSSGTVRAEQRFGPFGETLASNEPSYSLTEFGYRGRLLERATGMYDNRARFYDAESGRFVARDSLELGLLASTRASFGHPYGYGNSSPLQFSDPSGRVPVPSPDTSECSTFYNDASIAQHLTDAFRSSAVSACRVTGESPQMRAIRLHLQNQYSTSSPENGTCFSALEHKRIHDAAYAAAGCSNGSAPLFGWWIVNNSSWGDFLTGVAISIFGPCGSISTERGSSGLHTSPSSSFQTWREPPVR